MSRFSKHATINSLELIWNETSLHLDLGSCIQNRPLCRPQQQIFMCLPFCAGSARSRTAETPSWSTHLRFVSQSQTSSRSAKWQRKGGAKGLDTKYFYQALDPCTVQFSARLGYLRLTFRLGCRKHLFDLNLNVNPKHQHPATSHAQPSPAQRRADNPQATEA